MKPAKYTLSDSESEAENFDNDDLLFSTEPMDILSSIDRDQKFDNLISAVKVSTFTFILRSWFFSTEVNVL